MFRKKISFGKMAKLVISLALLVGVCVAFSSAQNYCNLKSCQGKPHTLCSFTSDSPAAACGNNPQVGLTAEEQKKALDKHNELRQRVARGEEKLGSPGPQPAAKTMSPLEWDEELANIAQRWASQCNYGHDACRNVERFNVGQNVAYRGTTADVNSIKVEDLVMDWYNEVKDYNSNDVSKFTKLKAANGKDIGHYTQFVWGKTTKLGCGAVRYKDGGFNKFYLVCNYGPSGNFLGQPVYEKVNFATYST